MTDIFTRQYFKIIKISSSDKTFSIICSRLLNLNPKSVRLFVLFSKNNSHNCLIIKLLKNNK